MHGPVALLTASFLLGLALPWRPPTAALVAASLALSLWALARWRARPALAAAALVAAAFLAGGARREGLAMPAWSRVPVADATLLRGRVVRGCAGDGDVDRCRVARADGALVDLRVARGRCAAAPGDVLEAVVTLRPLVPLRNPPLPPPELARVLRGVRHTADAAACEVVGRDAGPVDRLRALALSIRSVLERSLSRSLPPAGAGRARALLFGDRSGLDDAEHEAFRESGMAHLLAVSGAHVSLLVSLTGALLRAALARVGWIARRGLAPRLALALPLPLVGVFVAVTGESPASVRAWLTALAAAVASLAGRRCHGESTVALVALAMAAVDPTFAEDLGWVLSVVASWALARGDASPAPPDETLAAHLRREVASALGASARVAVAVAPVLAWHFGRSPLTAVAMNAVAAPVGEALLLPAVLLASALGLALPAPVAALGGRAVDALLAALFALPRAALAWPLAAVPLPSPTPAQWVAATACAVAACGLRPRGALAVSLAGVCLCGGLELAHRASLTHDGALRVTALDVGQGDAVVVELPDGAAMLVDAGGALTGGPDPGARVVLPWLAQRRRASLAAVVLSHPHPDHGGGLAAVLRGLHVGALWDTGQGAALGGQGVWAEVMRAARARGVAVLGPSALCGGPHPFHGATLEVLAPCPEARAETPPNDASFVLRITHGRASVLLPGDLERAGEAALLARVGRVDVLKVGHHGSATSTTDAWLDALRPRVAMISCGHPSPFGHPHPDVLARLAARRVRVLRTDLHGAVTVTLHADGRVE